ncbi:MAG: BlaI/MecI/CopY family transcriptional regulator [Verrucomicrobiae bacterium]|nr:BlaI/MecI/CopY family transcriptional regulator [Verrucomicrobiae bacterium]
MKEPSQELSRRERQIMDVLYARGEADVQEVMSELPDAPGDMGMRKLLSILEEKGQVKRRKSGRKFVYAPRKNRRRVGTQAFRHLLKTFFSGSVDEALAAHLGERETNLTDEQLERMSRLIEEARSKKEGDQTS